MAEVNTIERYSSKTTLASVISGIKLYVDNSGGGGGGGGSDPDGTTVINRDSSGEITSIVFTYSGGVTTTTFAETASTKYIFERDVKTGASSVTLRTTSITGDTIVVTTTIEPVSS